MLITVIDGGDGSGADSAAYMVGAIDSKGVRRAGLSVLRGDPVMVAGVIDSISNYLRYTSIAINLRDDRPTREQISAVLDDLCRWTHAGLEPRSVCVLQVEHRKWAEDRLVPDLHILIPRLDLATGLAFNPMPPGWETPLGFLCDAHNFQYGWARGTDPKRERPAPLDIHHKRKKRRKGGAEEGIEGNLIDLGRARKARDAFEQAVARRAELNRMLFSKRRLKASGLREFFLVPSALTYEQRLLEMVGASPSSDLFRFITSTANAESAPGASTHAIDQSAVGNNHHDRNRASTEQGVARTLDQPKTGDTTRRKDRRLSGGGAGLAEAARQLGKAVQGLYGAIEREYKACGKAATAAGKLARSLQDAYDRVTSNRALQHLARLQIKPKRGGSWWMK
jgi:hypothetical protein